MSKYLLIESRDPFENRSSEEFLALAAQMSARGDQVILFLVQNGVLTARKANQHSERIRELVDRNVQVLADAFSLEERGIQKHERLNGVKACAMEQLIEIFLEPERKAIWH